GPVEERGCALPACLAKPPEPLPSGHRQEATGGFPRPPKPGSIQRSQAILDLYPHELSGGMRQRIMIAIALSAKPSLLIADEPTSALDITTQAQVLTLMKELVDEVRTSILFISHDLGVIAEMADDVGVLYAGHLVEFGPVEEVFADPRHPYTKALLRSVPKQYKD